MNEKKSPKAARCNQMSPTGQTNSLGKAMSGIKCAREYAQIAEHIEELPLRPDLMYEDWAGWDEFLKVPTLCKACGNNDKLDGLQICHLCRRLVNELLMC